MIFGFNSEVRIGNGVYHVQTEDYGAQKHMLETTVYLGGRLVHRRKVSYEELLQSPHFSEAEVRAKLEEQHRAVIEELRSGELTFEVPPPKMARPATQPIAKPGQAPLPAQAKPAAPAPARTPAAPTVISPPRQPAAPSAPAAATAPAPDAQPLNPAAWYAGGTATLRIDVKSKDTNQPLADASLQVVIQSPAGPITFATKSDSRGRVQLVFPLPTMGPAGTDVIIRAPDNSDGEIRYSLKPSTDSE